MSSFRSLKLLLLSAAGCALLPVSSHAAVTFSFPNFSSTAGLNLVGSTIPVNLDSQTVLRLTPSSEFQGGAVWSSSPISFATPNGGFSTFFQFRITNPGGISTADGIVWTIQTVSSGVGGTGGLIGYGGITPSVGVEFDTFVNEGNSDPNNNHVGVNVNGNMTSILTASPGGVIECTAPVRANCLANGNVWSVWIDYTGTTLSVALADNSTVRPANLISTNINIPCILAGGTAGGTGCPTPASSAFVGFTSGTGSGYENHYLLNWIHSNSFNPIIPPSPAPALSPWAMAMLAVLMVVMAAMLMRKRPANSN
jgi:hypothetical protein